MLKGQLYIITVWFMASQFCSKNKKMVHLCIPHFHHYESGVFNTRTFYPGITTTIEPPCGKPTMWFPNRSDTNQAAQSQKQARSLKFWI